MLDPMWTVAEILGFLRSCNKYLILLRAVCKKQKRTISVYLYIFRTHYHDDSLGRVENVHINEY